MVARRCWTEVIQQDSIYIVLGGKCTNMSYLQRLSIEYNSPQLSSLSVNTSPKGRSASAHPTASSFEDESGPRTCKAAIGGTGEEHVVCWPTNACKIANARRDSVGARVAAATITCCDWMYGIPHCARKRLVPVVDWMKSPSGFARLTSLSVRIWRMRSQFRGTTVFRAAAAPADTPLAACVFVAQLGVVRLLLSPIRPRRTSGVALFPRCSAERAAVQEPRSRRQGGLAYHSLPRAPFARPSYPASQTSLPIFSGFA